MAYAALAQSDADVAAPYAAGAHFSAALQSEECALLPPPDTDTNDNVAELSSRLFMDYSPANKHSFTPVDHNITTTTTTVRSIHSTAATADAAREQEDSSLASTPDSALLSGTAVEKTVLGQPHSLRKQQQSPSQSLSTSRASDRPLPPPPPPPHAIEPKPVIRTASGRHIALRHPTPDWHSPQGSLLSNVEHLERTAERLSLTSSIEDAIRQMNDEQKRCDSPRSSLLASPIEIPQRKLSNHSSIVDVNSAARSGGYSPGGFNMTSTNPSLANYPRHRAEPRVSRFGNYTGSELEVGSLDSPASHSFGRQAVVSPSAPAANYDESPTITMTRPQRDAPFSSVTEQSSNNAEQEEGRPTTSASATSSEQAQRMFSDFDGEHYVPRSREVSESTPTLAAERPTSSGRLATHRPQSYADPSTGQQMVYYPAPVPIMLKLPEKLSKLPSTMARDKRRSQVLSHVAPSARQSAIWLPDVLEDEGHHVPVDDPTQQQEYMPQHQRQSMGGRRTVQDLEHLPPQLRASAFFEYPSISQTVELKGNSAVKTLDSILNASAFAPVSAFIDHAFAGRLGPEVYGSAQRKATKVKSQISEKEKRSGSFNIFHFRQSSSKAQLVSEPAEKRRSTMPGLAESRMLSESPKPDSESGNGGLEDQAHFGEKEDGEENESASEQEEPDEEDYEDYEIYQGAPTTLLAELQLRKQQLKERTRPATITYPNGTHSTLLERDAVAQIEKTTRNQQRVNLAWEDPAVQELERTHEVDDDVPLGVLFPHQTPEYQAGNRPMGLMEKRDMEDNEPLSKRRDRLFGRPAPLARASTMFDIPSAPLGQGDEIVAEQARRLKEQDETFTGLPITRSISGELTTELLSQLGGEEMINTKEKAKAKGKETPVLPDEDGETLGQRRKRLQADREARAAELAASGGGGAAELRPVVKSRRSMADILSAHPAGGPGRSASHNFEKPPTGLLGLHERQSAQRSTQLRGYPETFMNNFAPPNQPNMLFGQYPQQQMMMPFANPYMLMGYNSNPMMGMGHAMQPNPMAMSMLQMAQNGQPLNQGQIDMVERWRQSVMH